MGYWLFPFLNPARRQSSYNFEGSSIANTFVHMGKYFPRKVQGRIFLLSLFKNWRCFKRNIMMV
jgi:hypothetical protein